MSYFNNTLFSASPFIRWSLSPFLLLTFLVAPLLPSDYTLGSVAGILATDALLLSVLASLWLPRRFGHGAFRVTTAVTFGICAMVLAESLSTGGSSMSHLDALFAFAIVGISCLLFTIRGDLDLSLFPYSRLLSNGPMHQFNRIWMQASPLSLDIASALMRTHPETSFAGARAEAQELLRDSVGHALVMLQGTREFIPHATARLPDDRIITVSSSTDPPTNPSVEQLRATLLQGATEGRYRATALFYTETLKPPGSDRTVYTLSIALDHRDHYSTILHLPLVLTHGEAFVGDAFAEPGDHGVFGKQAGRAPPRGPARESCRPT